MIRLGSEALQVCLLPEGAELCSVKNTAGVEFIWQADASVWGRHAPVLFPIVGKLKDNRYHHNTSTYELGQHGFARDMRFTVKAHDATSCLFELVSGDKTKSQYPFDFVLQIRYALRANVLETTYSVVNPSQNTLPFSIGAHPGFNCPLKEGETFEDYYIAFETETLILSVLENGLRREQKKELSVPGKKLFLSPHLFDNDALVFEGGQVNHVELRSSLSGSGVTLSSKDWPYFGIWSKKNCRRFVCLEPWYGIADSVSSNGELIAKDGIIALGAGKTFTCSFTIAFH